MLTEETKREILKDYSDKNNKTTDIANKYGISRSNLARIVEEMGGAKRYNRRKKTKEKGKLCPNCKRVTEQAGARFCCFCGSDIRNKREILIEKLDRILDITSLLPSNVRDEVHTTVLETIKELKGE